MIMKDKQEGTEGSYRVLKCPNKDDDEEEEEEDEDNVDDDYNREDNAPVHCTLHNVPRTFYCLKLVKSFKKKLF